MACPYGAIIWEEKTITVAKCTMCHERLDRGEDPACVATCFGGALQIKTVDSENEIESLENEMIGFTHYKETKPHIRFKTEFQASRQKENT